MTLARSSSKPDHAPGKTPASATPNERDSPHCHSTIILALAAEGNLCSLSGGHTPRSIARAQDKHGSTALHYAAGSGHAHVVSFLASTNHLSVHARSNRDGRTALHWAARNGHTGVCELLVRTWGAKVDEEAKGGVTPLQLAVWQCHVSAAQKLVELGANAEVVNGWGCGTAHWLALCPLFAACTENLKRKGYAVEAEMECGQLETPDKSNCVERKGDPENPMKSLDDVESQILQCCTWLGSVAHNTSTKDTDSSPSTILSSSLLFFHSANHHGQTPLHKAAYAGNIPMLKYLVHTLGIVDEVRDHAGNCAADCAERNGMGYAARYLRRWSSLVVRDAVVTLFGSKGEDEGGQVGRSLSSRCAKPPPLVKIRKEYLRMARMCHPDLDQNQILPSLSLASGDGQTSLSCENQNPTKTGCRKQWDAVQNAHILLSEWWQNPMASDITIRMLSRNRALQEHALLMWKSDWHFEQVDCRRGERWQMHGQRHVDIQADGRRNSVLSKFETNLLALLRTEGNTGGNGLAIERLPRQYAKNFPGSTVPRPKEHGCRKLIHLIRKHCPAVSVEYDENKTTARLKIA